MTHHARLNLIMAITIVVLIVFFYLRPQSDTAQQYSLSTTSIERVQRLRIVTPQQEIALHRSEGGWRLTYPVDASADAKKIEKILEILQAKSFHRFQREDLGRFGLNQPNLTLSIDDEYFSFGGFAPTTYQQYVTTKDYVYSVAPQYSLAVPAQIQDLIDPENVCADCNNRIE